MHGIAAQPRVESVRVDEMQEDAAGLDVLGQFLRRSSSGEQVETSALFDAQGFADGVITIENGEFGRGPAESAPTRLSGGTMRFGSRLRFGGFSERPRLFRVFAGRFRLFPGNTRRLARKWFRPGSFGPRREFRPVEPPSACFLHFRLRQPPSCHAGGVLAIGAVGAFSFLQLTYKAGKSISRRRAAPLSRGFFVTGRSPSLMGECPERQRGGTVNPLAMPS